MVVSEQTTESLTTFDLTGGSPDFFARLKQLVAQSLMIMGQERGNGISQRLLAEEDQPVETLFLQRSVKAFQVGVQVRAPRRQEHSLYALGLQDRTERRTKLAIAVHEHVTFADQESVFGIGQIPADLPHPDFVGTGRNGRRASVARPRMCDPDRQLPERHQTRSNAARTHMRGAHATNLVPMAPMIEVIFHFRGVGSDMGTAGRLRQVEAVVVAVDHVGVFVLQASPQMAVKLTTTWATWGEGGLPLETGSTE